MRLKQIIFLTALCGLLCAYGWVAQQTRVLEQQCYDMEQEARLLEQENAALRVRVEELKELHTVTDRKMQEWLDTWQGGDVRAAWMQDGDYIYIDQAIREATKMSNFLGADGHLDLEKVFEEVEWLYKEYGLEPDKNLSIDGRELKEKVLWFVNKVAGLSHHENRR